MTHKLPPGTIDLCDLCGEPLNADNLYGPDDDFPLCRGCHERFYQLIAFLENATKPVMATQTCLFEEKT